MSAVTQEQPAPRSSIFNDPKFRSTAIQVLLVLAIGWFVWRIIHNTQINLQSRNIASGYSFLWSTAGFGVNQALISYSEASSYGRALLVGFLNTLLVAAVGIILATILGFTLGIMRLSDDPTDDDSLLVDTGLVQRLLTNPGVLVFLVLSLLALAAERRLLSVSPLSGGQLAPAWGGASALWSEYLQGFHPASIGTAASPSARSVTAQFRASISASAVKRGPIIAGGPETSSIPSCERAASHSRRASSGTCGAR